jgi:release factor glutamine methyltransferase
MDNSQLFQSELQRINQDWRPLPDKPEETPELTLRALWHCAAGNPVSLAEAENLPLPDLSEEMAQKLRELTELRLSGQPLSYLTGRQTFMGIDLLASPLAMIPRKETEILGKAAVQTANALAEERGSIRIVDLCSGSGNLTLALAYFEPRARVTGIDISCDAVTLAIQNAAHLNLSDRANFYCGDLFAPIDVEAYHGQFDLITCNPPYISSAQVDNMAKEIHDYEPRLAFDGGPFGVRVLNRLLQDAPRFLKPDSYLCFEVGLGQGPALERLLKRSGAYTDIEFFTDERGDIRVLKARKSGETL